MGSDEKASYSLARLAEELGTTFHGQKRFTGALRSRKRFVHALREIVDYLDANGVHPLICLELNELALGLIELDRGTVRHFLKPSKAGGKTVDPDDIWRARAFLAIAVDLKVIEGSSRRAAAREIAALTKSLAGVVSKPASGSLKVGGNYAAALEKWHAAFEKEQVSSRGALLVFNDRQRVADIYRKKIKDRGDAPEMMEKRVIDSFLRDATNAAVRAADDKQLEIIAKGVRTKGIF
ncbi:hypothetical protein [Methylocystis echinoides]|uniref:hypothetical protein n=1 Tax=Methylocystis echinoides TaxID=29468 RepID=UPI00343BABD4